MRKTVYAMCGAVVAAYLIAVSAHGSNLPLWVVAVIGGVAGLLGAAAGKWLLVAATDSWSDK